MRDRRHRRAERSDCLDGDLAYPVAASATIGLSIPLGERFDISTDVTFRQSDATEASGGVAALPATGSQMFLNATLVGTSILRENDLMLFSLRHNTTRTHTFTHLRPKYADS